MCNIFKTPGMSLHELLPASLEKLLFQKQILPKGTSQHLRKWWHTGAALPCESSVAKYMGQNLGTETVFPYSNTTLKSQLKNALNLGVISTVMTKTFLFLQWGTGCVHGSI